MANRVVETVYQLKDRATEVLRKISGATTRNANEVEKGSKRIERANKSSASSFRRTADAARRVRAGLLAITAAAVGLFAGLTKVTKAADEQERAEALLENTLKKLAGATDLEIDALKRQAVALQQATRFGDEQTISAQAMLGTFQLTADQIARITPGLLDMAEASRKGAEGQADLNSIAIAVGKAFTSGIGSLSRYGVALTDVQKQQFRVADQAGKVAIVVDALKGNFDGAAAAAGATFGGQVAKASNAVGDFLEKLGSAVGQSEPFQRVISRITELFSGLSGSTSAGSTAVKSAVDRIGETFNSLLSILESSGRFIRDNATALSVLAKAYAGVKIVQFITAISTATAGLVANAAASRAAGAAAAGSAVQVGVLSKALRLLPTSLLIGIALVGAQTATKLAKSLGESLAALAVDDELTESQARLRDQLTQTINKTVEAMGAFSQFRDVQLQSAEAVAALSEKELSAYRAALEGLAQYNALKLRYLLNLRETRDLTAEESAELGKLNDRITATRQATVDLASGLELAARIIETGLNPAQQNLIAQLEQLEAGSKSAGTQIKAMFESALNASDSVVALGDLGVALSEFGQVSAKAAADVRTALAGLDSGELVEFTTAARAAFNELEDGGTRAGQILQDVVQLGLERLSVGAEQLGVDFTQNGRKVLDTLTAIGETGVASSAQLTAAYQQAISSLSTGKELDAAKQQLAGLFRDGSISAQAYAQLIGLVKDRIEGISAVLDPLAADFERLGITAEAEMQRAATASEESFRRIAAAVEEGKASQGDAQRAFVEYARKQIELAEASGEASRQAAAKKIQEEAAVRGYTKALVNAGIVAQDANEKAKDSSDKTKKSIDEQKESVDRLTGAYKEVGDAGAETGRRVQEHVRGSLDVTERASDAAAGFFAQITGVVQSWRALGPAAAKAVDQMLERVHHADQSIEAFNARLTHAIETFEQLQAQEQTTADSLITNFRQAGDNAQYMAGELQTAIDTAVFLDQQRLDGLKQALASAQSQAQSFSDSLLSGLQDARRELAQLRGETTEYNLQQQQNEIAELEAQLRNARLFKNQEDIKRLTERLKLEREILKLKQDQAAQDKKSADDASRPSNNQPTTTRPRAESPARPGSVININNPVFLGANASSRRDVVDALAKDLGRRKLLSGG